ncbi:MAG: hypothetical protein WD696_03905 [Bryobacteraceae bacterium]
MATVDDHGQARTLSAEEFIDEIEDALMELSERNPLLANANVEVERVTSKSAVEAELGPIEVAESESSEAEVSGEHEDPVDADKTEDDLEEFETGLYLCRWPNGEFSLVKADDRKDAVVQLDEWAGAEPAWLVPIETCMIDFRLNDRGEVEVAEFGEETAEFIWEKCYPELDQVLSSEDVLKHLSGKHSQKAASKIRKAVEHERKRLWKAQVEPTPAKTALGRELQKRLGTVGPGRRSLRRDCCEGDPAREGRERQAELNRSAGGCRGYF